MRSFTCVREGGREYPLSQAEAALLVERGAIKDCDFCDDGAYHAALGVLQTRGIDDPDVRVDRAVARAFALFDQLLGRNAD